MVAGGFWLLVATEGPGGGMCQIWRGKIWCKQNWAPVFQIEFSSTKYPTHMGADQWLLGCCFLWTFHWLQLFLGGY